MQPKKPNFLIIGAAKCGTTTLAAILADHPDVCMSQPKEVSFFQDTTDFKTNPNYGKGWDWYQHAFLHYNGEKLVGEATPSYSDRTRSPKAAQRIFEFNPDMKLIYMVRNPVKRQISAWKMQFAVSLSASRNSYHWKIEYEWASKGFEYWLQKQKEAKQWGVNKFKFNLDAYLQYFPTEQIYITFLEDWKENQNNEVTQIFDYLGLENDKPEIINKRENTAQDKLKLTSLAKKTAQNNFLQKLKFVTPPFVKKYIVQRYFFEEIRYPPIDMNAEVVQEFISYVEEDSKMFLINNGKPMNFWNLKNTL